MLSFFAQARPPSCSVGVRKTPGILARPLKKPTFCGGATRRGLSGGRSLSRTLCGCRGPGTPAIVVVVGCHCWGMDGMPNSRACGIFGVCEWLEEPFVQVHFHVWWSKFWGVAGNFGERFRLKRYFKQKRFSKFLAGSKQFGILKWHSIKQMQWIPALSVWKSNLRFVRCSQAGIRDVATHFSVPRPRLCQTHTPVHMPDRLTT